MKMKIILLTLVSGTAALLIAQQTPSPGSAISPNKPAPIPPPSRQQSPPPPENQQTPPSASNQQSPAQNNQPNPGAAPNISNTQNFSGQNVSNQNVNGQNISTQSVAGQNYSLTNPVTAHWTGTNWEDNPSPRFIRGGVNTNNPYGRQQ